MTAPLAYGATDVDLVTGTETSPHIIQSETYSTANPDNPNQIVVAYNDSRGAATSNFSGASVSTDGGATFTRLTNASGQSPFANTFGDPVVLYNKPTGTWFTVWLDAGGGGQGLGWIQVHHSVGSQLAGPISACIPTGSDDRESGWADNNPASPFYGRMYVSWNDFSVGGGALQVRFSTDNGATWHARVTVDQSQLHPRRADHRRPVRQRRPSTLRAWMRAVAVSRTTTPIKFTGPPTAAIPGPIHTPAPRSRDRA